jgi:hypothetical protein
MAKSFERPRDRKILRQEAKREVVAKRPAIGSVGMIHTAVRLVDNECARVSNQAREASSKERKQGKNVPIPPLKKGG